MRYLQIALLVCIVIFCISATSFCADITLRLATTTSLENSGLLDILLGSFEKKYGVRVHTIAVGTGKALKMGENGDVDIVMVHAPSKELEFMENGYGSLRKTLFYSDFLVVGPSKGRIAENFSSVPDFFRKISNDKLKFVSRGDYSGTHFKELEIWNEVRVKPMGDWYLESGQGMGQTLIMADEMGAYCLTDSATFYSYQHKIDMTVAFKGGRYLNNPYSVIIVNPEVHAHTNDRLAGAIVQWLSSKEAMDIVTNFRKNSKQLFYL